jgi:hypothetical protein
LRFWGTKARANSRPSPSWASSSWPCGWRRASCERGEGFWMKFLNHHQ